MPAREDVSEEERGRATNRLVELAKLVAGVGKRRKVFIFNVLKIGGGAVPGIVAIVAAVLGVNVKLPSIQGVRGVASAASSFSITTLSG